MPSIKVKSIKGMMIVIMIILTIVIMMMLIPNPNVSVEEILANGFVPNGYGGTWSF